MPVEDPDERSRLRIRLLVAGSVLAAFAGALLGVFDATRTLSTFFLVGSLSAFAAGALLLGLRPPAPEARESEDERFSRVVALHLVTAFVYVLLLFLALIEVLAIIAALGSLTVFGEIALALLGLYPAYLGLNLVLLAGLVLISLLNPRTDPIEPRARAKAIAAFAVAGATTLASVIFALGAAPGDFKLERAVFILAVALLPAFHGARVFLRGPTLAEVGAWLDREERLKRSEFLRRLAWVFTGLALVALLIAFIPFLGVLPRVFALFSLAIAALCLFPATVSVGVAHVEARLEMGEEGLQAARSKRRILLNAASVALTSMGGVLGVVTFLAFLAQVMGVELFDSVLSAFVAVYPAVLAVAMLPLLATVVLRTKVPTELRYTERHQALTVLTGAIVIVLLFFGVFIGSGLAQGTGILIENAVLAMSGAVLALILFVKTRTLLPSVFSLLRESVQQSADADEGTREDIRRSMLATYVGSLLFVVGFVAFVALSSFDVVEPPKGFGTDLGFLVFLLGGLGLLVLLGLRYLQHVNIDPSWAKKEEKAEIGRKRLSPDELQRYLVLGSSATLATILFVLGVLVQVGVLSTLGPVPLAKKYATDFWVFAILIGLGPYGFYLNREAKRVAAIDAKFPEFLRDLAESQRAGMTLTEAVLTASKGNYGMLTPEIRKMAVQIEWGVAFSDALERFAKRVKTPLIGRTVSLIVQAAAAGGNVVDVLTAAADDSRDIQMILKERRNSMSIYVMIIYIAFFVFMGVIAILNAQFIPEVAKAVSKADGVSIAGLTFRTFDPDDFKTLFFHAAIIQGFGGGLVGGVMSGGKPTAGLPHAFVMISAAYVVFRFLIGG